MQNLSKLFTKLMPYILGLLLACDGDDISTGKKCLLRRIINEYGYAELTYNEKGLVTMYEYVDLRNSKYGSTSRIVTIHYDASDKVVQISQNSGVVRYSYDNMARVISCNYFVPYGDPTPQDVRYTYDDRGVIDSIIYNGVRRTKFEYNADTVPVKRYINRNGEAIVLTEYEFDDTIRPTFSQHFGTAIFLSMTPDDITLLQIPSFVDFFVLDGNKAHTSEGPLVCRGRYLLRKRDRYFPDDGFSEYVYTHNYNESGYVTETQIKRDNELPKVVKFEYDCKRKIL
jgi:YD repeat-containing protein